MKEKIHEEGTRDAVRELLREEEIEEIFRYLDIYRNSLSDEDEIKDAEELIRYYENNREGLLPYQSQGLALPDPPEGLEYRNMGAMENHVWSMDETWTQELEPSGQEPSSEDTSKKCSGKLHELTKRLRRPIFEEEKVEELYGEILMSARAPKKTERAINIQQ